MEARASVDALLSNRLFRGLNISELEELSLLVRKRVYNIGQFIVHQGDLATELYIIDHGTVEIIKQDVDNKKEYRIATLIDGDCIGEVTLFDYSTHSARSASARALSPTDMLVISVKELQALVVAKSPYLKILINLAQEMSLRLRRTSETAIDFLKKDFQQIDMSKLAAGIKAPPLHWKDREEIFKEAMLFRELNSDAVVITVADATMAPIYNVNDYVGGKRHPGADAAKFVGRNCIIETDEHGIYVRRIDKLDEHSYQLSAINSAFANESITISDHNILTIAPIMWHRSPEVEV